MYKFNKKLSLVVCALFVVAVVYFLFLYNKEANYVDLVIPGISSCTKDCLSVDIKTVYTGTDVEVSEDDVYSGNITPQICSTSGFDYGCKELDISKISGYKIINRIFDGKSVSLPNFSYINRFAESRESHKAYLIYRVLSDSLGRTVYDDPLVVVSYDTLTGSVINEGQLNISGLKVQDVKVSPDGSYILINSFSSRRSSNTATSSILLFNLKNKEMKILDSTNGGWLTFVSWIDNNHFLYTYNLLNSKSVQFKFLEIN